MTTNATQTKHWLLVYSTTFVGKYSIIHLWDGKRVTGADNFFFPGRWQVTNCLMLTNKTITASSLSKKRFIFKMWRRGLPVQENAEGRLSRVWHTNDFYSNVMHVCMHGWKKKQDHIKTIWEWTTLAKKESWHKSRALPEKETCVSPSPCCCWDSSPLCRRCEGVSLPCLGWWCRCPWQPGRRAAGCLVPAGRWCRCVGRNCRWCWRDDRRVWSG